MSLKGYSVERPGEYRQSLEHVFLEKNFLTEADIDVFVQNVIIRIEEEVPLDRLEDPRETVVIMDRLLWNGLFFQSLVAKILAFFPEREWQMGGVTYKEIISECRVQFLKIERVIMDKVAARLAETHPAVVPSVFRTAIEVFQSNPDNRTVRTKNPYGHEQVVKVHEYRDTVFEQSHDEAVEVLLSSLIHPAIVPTQFGKTEYDKHITQAEFLPELRKMSPVAAPEQSTETLTAADLMNVFTDISEAIEYLDKLGLVLMDISPHNIGYIKKDAKRTVGKLFDFDGLVKKGEHLLPPNGLLGRQAYKPPEYENKNGVIMDTSQTVFQIGLSLFDTLWPLANFHEEKEPRFTHRFLTAEALDAYMTTQVARASTVKDVEKNDKRVGELLVFVKKMCDMNPNERPSIQEVVHTFKQLKDVFDSSVRG